MLINVNTELLNCIEERGILCYIDNYMQRCREVFSAKGKTFRFSLLGRGLSGGGEYLRVIRYNLLLPIFADCTFSVIYYCKKKHGQILQCRITIKVGKG